MISKSLVAVALEGSGWERREDKSGDDVMYSKLLKFPANDDRDY